MRRRTRCASPRRTTEREKKDDDEDTRIDHSSPTTFGGSPRRFHPRRRTNSAPPRSSRPHPPPRTVPVSSPRAPRAMAPVISRLRLAEIFLGEGEVLELERVTGDSADVGHLGPSQRRRSPLGLEGSRRGPPSYTCCARRGYAAAHSPCARRCGPKRSPPNEANGDSYSATMERKICLVFQLKHERRSASKEKAR